MKDSVLANRGFRKACPLCAGLAVGDFLQNEVPEGLRVRLGEFQRKKCTPGTQGCSDSKGRDGSVFSEEDR